MKTVFYECRRKKRIEVKKESADERGDKVRITVFRTEPDELIKLFSECEDCKYGKWCPIYRNGNFLDREWKTCLFKICKPK